MIKKPILTFLAIIAAIIIANIGAYINFPEYKYNPILIFAIWVQLFPNIPPISLISSMSALLFLAFATRQIFFGKQIKEQKNKYGYANLIKSKSNFNKYKKDFGLNFKSGIFLGKIGNNFIRSNNPLSTLILAPPGTGKTAAIIIPNLLLCDNSAIIHDPKGEIYNLTANARRIKLGHKILTFDPVSEEETAKYNVFNHQILPKNDADLKAYINNIANIIFRGNKSTPNSDNANYFTNAAKSLFTFIALWLIHKNPDRETSIPDIRSKLLSNSDVEDTITQMIDNKDKSIPEYVKEDGRGTLLAVNSDTQWAGILGSIKEPLEIFGDPRIAKITGSNCDFTAKKLRKEKISLYLKIRDQDQKRLAPLMTMIIESLTTGLISQMPEEEERKGKKKKKRQNNQITLFLDEFPRLGKMEAIANLAAISRGYNLNTIFVAQDYEQIANTYGREYISIFESNCAYKIIFKQNNFETASKISKLIGNKTDQKVSTSKNNNEANYGSKMPSLENIFKQNKESNSTSTSKEGIALITPQDILNLDSNNSLLIIQGHASKPILTKNAFWFKEKKLKKLTKIS